MADDEFSEYDPTPYGGGYDLTTTYGKPLPPSTKICYPRSLPNLNSQPPHPLGSITSPYNNKEDDNSSSLVPVANQEKENLWYTDDLDNSSLPDASTATNSTYPWFEANGNGYEYDYGHGYGYGSGYGYGGQNLPTEYMEPCASLFGYFPCLSKTSHGRVYGNGGEQDGGKSEWRGAEEYLFGSSYNPYGSGEPTGQEVVTFQEPNYGYMEQQPSYEFNNHSWSQQQLTYYEEAYQQ